MTEKCLKGRPSQTTTATRIVNCLLTFYRFYVTVALLVYSRFPLFKQPNIVPLSSPALCSTSGVLQVCFI